MKIQNKVILLILSLASIFIIGIIIFKISEDAKIENLRKSAEKEKTISLQKTILSVGQSLEVWAFDITYWNEMVSFTKTGDTAWASINIISALNNFNAQYAWVYRTDSSLLYASDKKNELILDELLKKNFKKIYKKSVFCHFFIKTDEGLLEIRGAPITSSDDSKRRKKPSGYFYAGRVWSNKMLAELSAQTSSTVSLCGFNNIPKEDNSEISDNFLIKSEVNLQGWDGSPIMKVVSLTDSPMLRNSNEFLKNQIFYLLIFSFLILIIVAIFLHFSISKPLKIISLSLKEKNPYLLKDLTKNKAEFGNLSSLIIQFYNITESSLKKSEEKYRRIFENVQDVIFQADNAGLVTSVSPSVERYSGYKPGELIGKPMSDFLHDPRDLQKLTAAFKITGEVRNFETVLRSKNGEPGHVLINNHLLTDGNGKVIGTEGTIRDISELKIREEKIKKLSSAIEQSPVSVVITNTAAEIEYVNPKFTEVSGYSFDEVLGRNPKLLKSGQVPAHVYKKLWNTITAGKEWRGEFLNKKKNGELYWELVLISPIKNSSNEITNYMAIKEDITERKKIENELKSAKEKAEEMNSLKTAFLANMSHELRTPLIGILGFSQILNSELENAEWKEMAETISSGGQRLLETLNQILDLSKFESQKVIVNYETIKIDVIINECIELVKPEAAKKNLYIKTKIYETGITAVIDSLLLGNLLYNLIGNAVKFTSKGGITIELLKENSYPKNFIIIKVADTGIGISKKYHEIIFEEFRQASEGLDRSFEGSGLGLTISKKIAELFNGEIFVESEEGKGSTFIFKFPVNPFHNSAESKAEDGSGSKKTILYVDDDDASKKVLKLFLKNSYGVETAPTVEAGIEMINNFKFSIVLLDINLGGGYSGFDMLEMIRKNPDYSDVPIVAVTALIMESEKEEILARGFNGYISKPYSREELNHSLHKYLFSDVPERY